jgi:hypothetical protein
LKKRILFVTTSNLATNPRLVKEIDLAIENGFIITLLQFKFNGWSNRITVELKENYSNVQFIEISATRHPFVLWLSSTILQYSLSKLSSRFLSLKWLSFSINKRTCLIHWKLEKLNQSFDWVIAHNPGTFYPAYVYSKKINARLGIDVEDYHPGESNILGINNRMSSLMKKILPNADYCSFAAPLIEKEVKQKLDIKLTNSLIVINGFSERDFGFTMSNSSKLKFVWYSQNIDFGRGLEIFLDTVLEYKEKIHITLIGNLNEEFEMRYGVNASTFITHFPPISQVDLHHELCRHDVGLALDFAVNRNREIALTNKIVSYAQAGLYIFGFKTEGHESFIKEYSLDSIVIEPEREEILNALNKIIEIKKLNEFNKRNQFEKGNNLGWEKISKPLIQQWKK